MSLKSEIAELLGTYSDFLEFTGDNPFKIKAFRNASEIIYSLKNELEEYIASGEIKNIKGIGKGILAIIDEYSKTGKVIEYEQIKSKYPASIWELFSIKGLGAKKIKFLYEQINIASVDDLSRACRENKIAGLKGFGVKTQEKILKEIQRLNEAKKYLLLNLAIRNAEELLKQISETKGVIKCEVTGELRRIQEIISSIEIIVLVKDLLSFKNLFGKKYKLTEAEDHNNLTLTFLLNETVPCILYVVENQRQYTKLLFETTGSKEFLQKLNYQSQVSEAASETEIFQKLQHPFVIPEMREEIYFDFPAKLQTASNLTLKKFKGFLHFHTNYSDGLNALEEMKEECTNLGFEYAAVCDHSKSAFYANGMNEKKVLEQKTLIKELNKKNGLHIFHGVECDILSDGKLDFSNEVLKSFDFVVVSVHSVFGLSEEEMTKRIIKAVESEYSDLLGHPSGRLLLTREPYKVNMKKIIEACSANNVAIEINANPQRLDLDWRWIYFAREKGCQFSINPDAHSVNTIHEINYGIMIARKGGIQTNEVINCYSINDFKKFLNRKVNRKF